MSDLNKVIVEGRLVKSADLSHFTDGTPYCNFTIGNNETYKDQNGEYQSIGSFFDCQLKGNYAEIMCKHLLKGRGLKVVGRLKQLKWEDENGNKFSRVVIKVEEIHLNPTNNSGAVDNFGNNTTKENYSAEVTETEYTPMEDAEIIPF